MPFNLNTFSRDLSAFVQNLYLIVLVDNVSLKTLRNMYGYDLVGSPGEKNMS